MSCCELASISLICEGLYVLRRFRNVKLSTWRISDSLSETNAIGIKIVEICFLLIRRQRFQHNWQGQRFDELDVFRWKCEKIYSIT